MRTIDRAGSTDVGTPLVIVAILGAIALPRFWPMLPTWGRVLAAAALAALAIVGIVLAMQPTGFATRLGALEVEEWRRKERERRASGGSRDDSGGAAG